MICKFMHLVTIMPIYGYRLRNVWGSQGSFEGQRSILTNQKLRREVSPWCIAILKDKGARYLCMACIWMMPQGYKLHVNSLYFLWWYKDYWRHKFHNLHVHIYSRVLLSRRQWFIERSERVKANTIGRTFICSFFLKHQTGSAYWVFILIS